MSAPALVPREPNYRTAWLRHQCADESGSPTRSASSPVDVRAWAGAATAAPVRGAFCTEGQPALIEPDTEPHPVPTPYPTPTRAYRDALAILSSALTTRTA